MWGASSVNINHRAAAALVTYRSCAKPFTSTASNTHISLQGQGQNPHLTEESMEAQSSLDLAHLEPGLTLGVRHKELTA